MSRIGNGTRLKQRAKIIHSSNMAVYRQYGFWWDAKTGYQFVPSTQYGFVVVIPRDGSIGSRPIDAWVVLRPRALFLTWESSLGITVASMSLDDAISWYNSEGRVWEHIKS